MPSRRRNERGGPAGGGDLCLLPPEHSHIVYCDQAYYGPVSNSGADTGATGLQTVVDAGRGGCGGDAYGGSGGVTDRSGGGEKRDGYGDRQLIKWEDTIENITLGVEPNAPLAYTPVLELHHPIMSTIGAHGR